MMIPLPRGPMYGRLVSRLLDLALGILIGIGLAAACTALAYLVTVLP